MTSRPQYKLSIVIPVYNQEKLITKCLDNIPLRDDVEVIVVDDCSTDNTWEVLKNYNRFSFHLIRNKVNGGDSYSRSEGLRASQGKWVYYIDSDDYVLPEFNKFIDSLKEEYDICYLSNTIPSGEVWDDHGRVACWSYAIKRSFIIEHNLDFNRDLRYAGDVEFKEKVNSYNPKVINTHIIGYFYNYPRVGSLVWDHEHNK